jgi:adenosylcobinamide-GDP ribazoletransferase
MEEGAPSPEPAAHSTPLSDLLQGPLVALELLTILRLRQAPILPSRVFGASQAWFPAVGLALGLATWGLWQALDGYLGAAILGWLVVAALVVLSGGLHVDGLADTADGLFGGQSRDESLRIMRDSHIGAFGATAVIIDLGLKASCIAALVAGHTEALILAPALSRWSMVVAIGAFPYARPEGLGAAFNEAVWPWPAAVATLTAGAAALLLLGPAGLIIAGIAGATALAAGGYVSHRLGGLTGDIYGAINECSEVAVLLAFLVLAAEGVLS